MVIGGGLTAIDTATELLAYYVIQAEKTAERYRGLAAERGEEALRAGFDAEELGFLDEQLAHADAIFDERRKAAGREPSFQGLLDRWGGVFDRLPQERARLAGLPPQPRRGQKKPRGRALRREPVAPRGRTRRAWGHQVGEDVDGFAAGPDGKSKATDEVVELPARTLCVAAGTSPNTTFEKENPGIFALDARRQFFLAHEAHRGDDGSISLSPTKGDASQAFFTSYSDDQGRTVSFYGDNHPYYAGSVVKAMASAKVGFSHVAALYADRAPVDDAERNRRRERASRLFRALDSQLIATVHDVIRLTPTIVEVIVHAPLAARNFQPGQFYRLQKCRSSSAPPCSRASASPWKASPPSPAPGSTKRRA